MTAMRFERAKRKQAKLRLGLTGPSGSGKTLSALLLAEGLGGPIAVLDTERDSASLYAEPIRLPSGEMITPPEFDALSLGSPYTPERYIEAIRAAESAGYKTMIIDSITHEWSGVGGCLELVDEIARAKYRGNSWSAWNDITPRHRAFIDAILQSNMHIIVTMRSKTETAQQEGNNGKKTVVKLGMKAEQRDGFEYELTTVLDLSHDGHYATASKDRTGLFMGRDPSKISPDTGRQILAWLESGITPAEPRVSEESKAEHLQEIHAAKTIQDLQAAFVPAYRAAQAMKDIDAIADFTKAKDERKAQLEAKNELPPSDGIGGTHDNPNA